MKQENIDNTWINYVKNRADMLADQAKAWRESGVKMGFNESRTKLSDGSHRVTCVLRSEAGEVMRFSEWTGNGVPNVQNPC